MLLIHISVTFDIIYYISTSEQEIFEYLTTRSISIIEDNPSTNASMVHL